LIKVSIGLWGESESVTVRTRSIRHHYQSTKYRTLMENLMS
jgi:hypothetical protein